MIIRWSRASGMLPYLLASTSLSFNFWWRYEEIQRRLESSTLGFIIYREGERQDEQVVVVLIALTLSLSKHSIVSYGVGAKGASFQIPRTQLISWY